MTTLNSITPLTSIARPLFGMSLAAVLLIMFNPLLNGLIKAVALMFKQRVAVPAKVAQYRLGDTVYLNRLARECDAYQPSLAAELRGLACMDCAND